MKSLISSGLLVVTTLSTLSIGCSWVSPRKEVKGTVRLAPELKEKVGPSAVLYVVARDPKTPSNPPVAVKRFMPPLNFPLEFKITPKDAMIPNTTFKRELVVTARIAQAGSATPINPGDIEGKPEHNPVRVGGDPVTIELNQVRQ